MNKYEQWIICCQFFTAFGTILVAFIAIYGDSIKSKYLGPKLKIFLRDPCGEINYLKDKTPQIYHHLVIVNLRRSSKAHNVRVVLTKLFKQNNRHELVSQVLSGPLQLTWQFPNENPQYMAVGPDRISDLGFLTKGKDIYIPSLYFYPNNFTGFVCAGERIRLSIMASADNAESNELLIDISWNGQWSNDLNEMKENLKVAEVKEYKETLNFAKNVKLYFKNQNEFLQYFINKLKNW